MNSSLDHATDISSHIKRLPPILLSAEMYDVLGIFQKNKEATFFPVVDDLNVVMGVVREYSLKDYTYGRFGRELIKRESVKRFMTRSLVVSVETPLEEVLRLSASNENPDGIVVVTRDARYEGIVLNASILWLFEEMRSRTSERLLRSQRLESIGTLAGGIAHDFNNVLAGIFGYIDLAKDNSRDEKVSQYLTKAMNTIDRARKITQQLLTFAKGGVPVRKIDGLFPFVQEKTRFALSGSPVSCIFDVPQNLWTCNYDKEQIGQVVENIVINAQQAMPDGGTIAVYAQNLTFDEDEHIPLAAGNYVKFSVRDCGVGIPPENLTRIFDPFYTTKAKGRGLGLATCYSIVNRHGGCIEVESEPGKGSTFHVYLPACAKSDSSPGEKDLPGRGDRGKVLIMDDEEMLREIVGDMLETLGYAVICKSNGREAIDFFLADAQGDRTLSGMIFDLTVPGNVGGKAAVEEIRKWNAEIPVFVASGYAEDPVMMNPEEYGFTASIRKPFSRVELTEMLDKYLKPSK